MIKDGGTAASGSTAAKAADASYKITKNSPLTFAVSEQFNFNVIRRATYHKTKLIQDALGTRLVHMLWLVVTTNGLIIHRHN